MMYTDQATRLRQIVKEASLNQDEAVNYKDEKHAKIYAIASGKGGVGKTNLSVNLAIALARKGRKVAIVDLDLGLANVDILLDLTAPYNLEHLVLGYKTLEDIIVSGPDGVKIVPGGSGLPSLTDLSEEQRNLFLTSFYKLSKDFDIIIFDTAAGISENVIRFTLAADEIIVVTTEEPTAVTDAYALMKVLSAKNKNAQINLVFNMVKRSGKAKINFEKIRSVVKQFLGIEIVNLGCVQYDPSVSQAIMKRKPFVLQYPFSVASKSVREVAKLLIQKENKKFPRRNLFQKLSTLLAH